MGLSFNAKMVFLFWLNGLRLWGITRKARKYAKYPGEHPQQQRNDYLLHKAKRLLKQFNIKLHVEGYDNLPKGPVLLTPNHKSNMDPILVFAALAKQTADKSEMNKIPTFIAKKELADKKIAAKTLSLLDTFYIDRQNPRSSLKSLQEFGDFIKNNKTYGVVFPEGTRVDSDQLGEFKAGAFKTAITQFIPIVPVAISDSRGADDKKRSKKMHITVTFLKPIKPMTLMTMNPISIASMVKEKIEGVLNNGKN